ncbi:MAG TPA: MCE family protein [Jatrophihabitans sp.]|nr:MCE family protein [Jatrophihabitans sp.]
MNPTRARDAAVGLLYLVLITALIALSVMVYDKDFSHEVRVSLSADAIGNELQKGSDVKVRGVLVGRVAGLSASGSGARIELALDPARARQLPANVTAQLLPKTLFGERYVSLDIPAAPAGTLRAGAVIQQDRSARAVELQQVFDHLLPVLQAIEPDRLASLLGELAQGLRDRGTELGHTLRDLGGYLTALRPQVPELTQDLAALGSVATTYQAAVPDLVGALTDFTATAQTVYAERQQLATLFATVTGTGNDVTGFVDSNSRSVIGLTADSLPTLKVISRYSSEFPCLTQALAHFVPISDQAFGGGTDQPGAHVTLSVVPSLGKYLPGQDAPQLRGDSGPRCPYVPGGTAVSNTAVGTASPARTGASPATAAAAAGLGTANSPGENELIAELVAPGLGIAPDRFPDWGSLLLGPALRGTAVTVR